MLNIPQHNVMQNMQGGVLGLFGYGLTLVFKITEFEGMIQSIIMAVITTTVGVLTKFLWDKILKRKKRKTRKK